MTDQELGDAAFEAMDRMLEDAEFRSGVIVLFHGEGEVVYCHSSYTLRQRLRDLVTPYLQWKFNKIPDDFEDIINNIFEEYDDEIRDSFAKDLRPKVYKPTPPHARFTPRDRPRFRRTPSRPPMEPYQEFGVPAVSAPVPPPMPTSKRYKGRREPTMRVEFPPHMQEQKRQYEEKKKDASDANNSREEYPRERPSRHRNAS